MIQERRKAFTDGMKRSRIHYAGTTILKKGAPSASGGLPPLCGYTRLLQ